jgi:anti-sigma regulatory factor (Ser/Thr protein kinase)
MSSLDPAGAPHDTALIILSFVCAAALIALVRYMVLHGRRRPPPLRMFAAMPSTQPQGPMELQPVILDVLQRFEQTAALRLVQLEIALQEGLTVLAPRAPVDAALAEVVSGAIRRAPTGRVLISTERRGDDIEIAVLDDGAPADPALIAASLRAARNALGPDGGTVGLAPPSDTGNAVLLHLPAPPLPRGWSPPPWVRERPVEPEGDA